MNRLSFSLPVVPRAQARIRHTRSGRAYKSASQLADERTLEALLMPHIPQCAIEGAIELNIKAFMPVPLSAGKRAREAMLAGKTPHTKKPDLDNLVKQMLDAMTRLRFWLDDRQVTRIDAAKAYGERPCWQIELQWQAQTSQPGSQ